jgi:uncharacterized protein (TIGR00297 family)
MTTFLWLQATVGLVLGLLLGWLGLRERVTSAGGALALIVCLTLVFGAAGWPWGTAVVIYALSLGLWSRYRTPAKRELSARFGPGALREASDVLGRLGWPTLLAIFGLVSGEHAALYAAFMGALATAAADGWATEVGVLSAEPPRLITSRRRVPAGTPGAVSSLGIVAALGASWLIGFVGLGLTMGAAWFDRQVWERSFVWLPLAAAFGGMAGTMVDSLLAATAQAVYHCSECDVRTEAPVHTCGERAQLVRGLPWLSNAAVDMVSSLVGAALAALLLLGLPI